MTAESPPNPETEAHHEAHVGAPPMPRDERQIKTELVALLKAQKEDLVDPLLPYQCGILFAELGEFDNALASYHEATNRSPKFGPAFYNMAVTFQRMGDLENALAAYQEALVCNQEDNESWGNMGALYEQMGLYQEASDHYTHALQVIPQDRQIQVRYGSLLLQQEHYDKALPFFESLIATSEQDEFAWNYLGIAHSRQGNLEKASDCYRKSLESDAGYADAWSNLGSTLFQLQDLKGAEKAYRNAISCESNNPNWWFNLGELYVQLDHKNTERVLLKVISLNQEDFEAWELLRQWYENHPNAGRMEIALHQLIGHDPNHYKALSNLAHIRMQQARTGEAEKLLKSVLALQEQNSDIDPADISATCEVLVGVSLSQNHLIDAFRYLQSLPINSAKRRSYTIHVAQKLMYSKQYDKAETCIRELLEQEPKTAEFWQLLGEIAMLEERWNDAFDCYLRTQTQTMNAQHIWLPLAKRMMEQGNLENAERCAEQLSEVFCHNPASWEDGLAIYEAIGKAQWFLEELCKWLSIGLIATEQQEQIRQMCKQCGLDDMANKLEPLPQASSAADESQIITL